MYHHVDVENQRRWTERWWRQRNLRNRKRHQLDEHHTRTRTRTSTQLKPRTSTQLQPRTRIWVRTRTRTRTHRRAQPHRQNNNNNSIKHYLWQIMRIAHSRRLHKAHIHSTHVIIASSHMSLSQYHLHSLVLCPPLLRRVSRRLFLTFVCRCCFFILLLFLFTMPFFCLCLFLLMLMLMHEMVMTVGG